MNNRVHLPVLLNEIMTAFSEQPRAPLKLLDGTFGRGGHTIELLKKFPQATVTAFDKDATAHEFAAENFKEYLGSRLVLIRDDFKNLSQHKLGAFDGALFDFGVSSPQFDVGSRGFSFMHDGPLDMRMDQTQTLTAKEIINTWSEKELSDLFYHWGEVRKPNRVVRALVHDRKTKLFETTFEVASLMERVDGRGSRRIHPATNYFMALRIAVNGELEGLGEFLESMPQHLNEGARLCVISFHSLEDRIAKNTFRQMNKKSGTIINKRIIIASDEEQSENPRSRSAKLRIFEMGVQ